MCAVRPNARSAQSCPIYFIYRIPIFFTLPVKPYTASSFQSRHRTHTHHGSDEYGCKQCQHPRWQILLSWIRAVRKKVASDHLAVHGEPGDFRRIHVDSKNVIDRAPVRIEIIRRDGTNTQHWFGAWWSKVKIVAEGGRELQGALPFSPSEGNVKAP